MSSPLLRKSALTFAALLLLCGSAGALTHAELSHQLEIPIPAVDVVARGDYQAEIAAHQMELTLLGKLGVPWHVQGWNRASDSPHLAYGRSVAVGAAPANAADLELLARSVIADQGDFFRVADADLALKAARHARGKWVAHFQQLHHGLPVWEATARLGFADDGRLMFMSSDLYEDIDLDPTPLLDAAVAVAVAQSDLPFDPATDKLVGEPELLVLPVARADGGADLHLVWRLRVETEQPLGAWVTHVDAHDGEIVWRYNDIHFAFGGDTQSDTQPITWCDGSILEPMPYLSIDVSGLGSTTSDAAGNWDAGGSGLPRTVSCDLQGPYIHVASNYAGAEAFFSGTATDGLPFRVEFDETNSQADERTVFDGVNDIHDFFDTFAPGFYYTNQVINGTVSRSDGYCPGNAWWNGSINFCAASGSYANTGEIQGVVQHEFGHGVQAALLGGWQGNQGLGEGNSDVLANLITQESIIGRGFYTSNCNSGIRNSDNNLVYPDDVVGIEIHAAGQVIAGFHWDAMLALQDLYGAEEGTTRAAATWHFGRDLMAPSSQPDQVFATFLADDDNGDLSDGSPDFYAYCAAALNHGFDCPVIETGVLIAHTPVGDTDDTGTPFTMVADITSENGPLDPATIELHWRRNGGAWQTQAMSPLGLGDAWSADIPPQEVGSVDYFFTAADESGAMATLPQAGSAAPFDFIVAWLLDAFESDSGWTAEVSSSADPAGGWVRVDPVGTAAQPEDDHSQDGTQCWITGQHTPGDAVDADDVDAGWVTLTTPTYDFSGANQVLVRYWRWYSNGGSNDAFKLQAANDGGISFYNVHQFVASTDGWEQETFDLMDLYADPTQVTFRWQIFDLGTENVVEAAVDDFTVLAVWDGTDVDEGLEVTLPDALEQNVPNPFNPVTQINFSLAAAGPAQLDVYDAQGRLVRNLVKGRLDAGRHSVTWDGRDEAGSSMASGVYFYRLESAEGSRSKRMLLIK